ncbi:carboxymuconolactone decarboxylase family protein [Acinetobacter sp. WZC-1]|uniref:carboxymuconolactone decarboxylase family protein n=1 Tax=Acinetobacter sp. WZC-1 TaxID=3459034 RepID=UPI00403DF780
MSFNYESKVNVGFPDMSTKPEAVRKRWEQLPTKLNLFHMMAHSSGSFVELMDVIDAIFKRLSLTDTDRELLVLLVSSRINASYEWDQHVVISQAFGVTEAQIKAIAEGHTSDAKNFSEAQLALLQVGEAVLRDGVAPGVIVNLARQFYSEEQICDVLITLGVYTMLAGFLRTLQVTSDAQEDGSWIKR